MAVTADESTGAVTTLAPSTGSFEQVTARYSPSSVKWSIPLAVGIVRFDLSRTDLTLVREIVATKILRRDIAACKILETPKRAF